MGVAEHERKRAALRSALAQAARRGATPGFGVAKPTSNLFRDAPREPPPRINLRHFDEVIENVAVGAHRGLRVLVPRRSCRARESTLITMPSIS